MSKWYFTILWTHIWCVIASGTVFFVRGCLMLADKPLANHVFFRRISVLIDTALLTAAIMLTIIIRQYPFVQAWLTVKVVLLLAYIVLGVMALRRGKTRATRGVFFISALAVFLFIISVARSHNPLGAFSGL